MQVLGYRNVAVHCPTALVGMALKLLPVVAIEDGSSIAKAFLVEQEKLDIHSACNCLLRVLM